MKEFEKIYEIGFHINPSIEEENLDNEFQKIKDIIVNEGGAVFAEEYPKIINLAYDIIIRADAGNSKYNRAYFGWVKFRATPESVIKIGDLIKVNKSIIRFILIKTDKANTVQFHKMLSSKKDDVGNEVQEGVEVQENIVSEVEIDKKIEDLIV